MLHSVAIILLYAATARAQVKIPEENPIVRIDLNATADLEPDSSATIINVDDAVDGTLEATAWSLIFTAAPVSQTAILRILSQSSPANQYLHTREFPTPETNSIVAVNVDVLYSFGVLDLSEADVLLGVPEFDDRYWSYLIWDFYGNAIAEISNVNGNTAGTYRLKRDAVSEVGLANGNLINISTAYASVAIRIGINSNTTEELDRLHSLQDASTVGTTDLSAETTVPSFAKLITPNITNPQSVLQFAASLLPYNPPQTVSDRERVNTILAQAGIGNGTYTANPDVDILNAASIARYSIEADLADPAHIVQLGNNWTVPIPSYQGNYGTHYAAQAASGIGYLQTQKLALLPNHPMLSGTIDFSTQSMIITFFGKPGVTSPGFWNIGSYDALLRLVPNGISRYSIGSKTSTLQYLEGGQVYGPTAAGGQDETFQVLLQSADIPPPANWTGNWLPVANNASLTGKTSYPIDYDSLFDRILVCMYWPEISLTDGSYVWPEIESLNPIMA
ncbi:hypothetical protein CGCFRS4_v010756 [Colletotrichum fructicola]|uniref:Uncharacterized protein n=1 Tax=Colletotrichum fructicola (strain Nara gc5) TaxID=1213859 RepID=L2GCP1_COLFN|nr:hypothetical protein CGCFRS4_v010756 [Colletotrichum fructicola]